MFKQIATLARLRIAHPAFTRGRGASRRRGNEAGLLVMSRVDPGDGDEARPFFGTPLASARGGMGEDARSAASRMLAGVAAGGRAGYVDAPGGVATALPAFAHAMRGAAR